MLDYYFDTWILPCQGGGEGNQKHKFLRYFQQVTYPMTILGPYAKNAGKISKNARDFVILKIFWQLCKISVIDIKCPSFGQI